MPITAVATWPLMHSTRTESLMRVEQAGDGVAHARARGHQHHADAAGAARIAFGRMDGRLLVPHQDVAQARLAVQRVVERQRGAARVAEDRVDAAFDQRLEQGLGTVAHARAGAGAGARASRRRVCVHASILPRSMQNVLRFSGEFEPVFENQSQNIRGNTEESFDKIDMAILRVLLHDSRKTLQEIGAEVGLSATTCWSRIKKLEARASSSATRSTLDRPDWATRIR